MLSTVLLVPAYDGLVDAVTVDCGDQCGGIHIPTTIDECADVGAVACHAISCVDGAGVKWRSFIVLNQYNQEVKAALQNSKEEKEENESIDWKHAADFNYFVCHAFIREDMTLKKLIELPVGKRPAFYQKYSNDSDGSWSWLLFIVWS